MVELPEGYAGGSATAELLDQGFLQRAALGGETARINRKGNRYRLAMTYGPYYAETGRVFVSKLISGKSQGLRIPFPLQVDQGSAGAPVVDGAGQTGTTLALRGLTPGYVCRTGYWLSIEDQNGRHYLHNVETGGMADASGDLSVVLSPELRWPFLDGATVHLTKPMVQGYVDGEAWAWQVSVDQVVPISFTLEEAA